MRFSCCTEISQNPDFVLLEHLESYYTNIAIIATSVVVSSKLYFSFTDAVPWGSMQYADIRAETVLLYSILRLKSVLDNVSGSGRLVYVKHFKSILISL